MPPPPFDGQTRHWSIAHSANRGNRNASRRLVRGGVLPCRSRTMSQCWSTACGKESLNLKMAQALASMAPPSMKLSTVKIRDLARYNSDYEDDPPAAWRTFRTRMKAADAVPFVTPGYNRSIPGVLKNAIDVGSRPYGSSLWTGKPGAVVSVTPGALGGFGAINIYARRSCSSTSPRCDPQGRIAVDTTRELVQKFLAAFARWIEQHTAPIPVSP